MYNVKGPSKIVAKTRRGPPQNIENFKEYRNNKGLENDDDLMNGPKPVFQNVPKRFMHNNNNNNQLESHVDMPQHGEIIKFINDSWNCVYTEVNNNNKVINSKSSNVVYYKDEPASALQNFKPFDLESWWGKRIYTCITSSINGNC
ncbi:PREDICTED: protein FAM195A [Nicrophorus vespilloides]|uniref:Protein FAM195A n=1 Tax=Nicrophorus vespilloides TaxID=110193 RepID=A0ABM1MGB9_NICVS|nr:PREDICTED: protein FAM195A [Nicrophorus vespilloides]XP_017773628.1 PREDICTED: protein FAM195A [Nicrophorus vespilloides]